MRRAGYPGHFWPSPLQEQVLRAALLPGEAGAAAWGRLRPELDIDDLWDSEIYRMLPLVQRNLQGLGLDDPDLPRMRGLARRTWYENQVRLQQIRRALERLRSAGIDLMVLKGVPLAIQYYRDLALRPMADVDVLVPTGAVEDALAVLEADGWPVSRRELRNWHGTGLVHPDGRTLDLHWHVGIPLLLADEARSNDDFWSASVPIEVDGLELRALCPADQLMHVLVHGSWAVSGAQVRWIADAAVVVRQAGDDLDWDRFVYQVARRRVMLPVRTALRYLAWEFEVPRALPGAGGDRSHRAHAPRAASLPRDLAPDRRPADRGRASGHVGVLEPAQRKVAAPPRPRGVPALREGHLGARPRLAGAARRRGQGGQQAPARRAPGPRPGRPGPSDLTRSPGGRRVVMSAPS